MPRVWVTTHALQRFRQRVAENGDATEADVLASFATAQLEEGALPFPRRPGSRYYRLPGTHLFFVVEQRSLTDARIVTVQDRAPIKPVVQPAAPKAPKTKPPEKRYDVWRFLDWGEWKISLSNTSGAKARNTAKHLRGHGHTVAITEHGFHPERTTEAS